ncbi:hypothetical protein ACFQV4_27300 [Streptomyces thermocarboxydus]
MTVPSGSFGWQADGRPPDRRVQVTGPARLTGTRNALHFEETATRPPPPTGLSASAPRRPGTARHPVRDLRPCAAYAHFPQAGRRTRGDRPAICWRRVMSARDPRPSGPPPSHPDRTPARCGVRPTGSSPGSAASCCWSSPWACPPQP